MKVLQWFSALNNIVQVFLAFFLLLIIVAVLYFIKEIFNGKTAKIISKKIFPEILENYIGDKNNKQNNSKQNDNYQSECQEEDKSEDDEMYFKGE